MKVLVTGATGNVGGAVLRALEGSGAEVWASGYQTEAPPSMQERPWRPLDFATGRGGALGAEYDAVLLLLHWWPRFGGTEPLADGLRTLTGREPEPLARWVDRHRAAFRPHIPDVAR